MHDERPCRVVSDVEVRLTCKLDFTHGVSVSRRHGQATLGSEQNTRPISKSYRIALADVCCEGLRGRSGGIPSGLPRVPPEPTADEDDSGRGRTKRNGRPATSSHRDSGRRAARGSLTVDRDDVCGVAARGDSLQCRFDVEIRRSRAREQRRRVVERAQCCCLCRMRLEPLTDSSRLVGGAFAGKVPGGHLPIGGVVSRLRGFVGH
jgi:hypothetical protein